MKRCYIIAGPNGAGKTTFAKSFLPSEGECLNFINVDLIAEGLSPLAPDRARIAAGRLLLKKIDACAASGESFAFETTLSGMGYVERMREWRRKGYEIIIYYLRLPSVEMAIDRVRVRVAEGGHDVPEEDTRRRFHRGWNNFVDTYQDLADAWVIFDTSGPEPIIVEESRYVMSKGEYYARLGYAALCRAALQVAERAKKENRKLPLWQDGHIVYGFPSTTPQKVAAAEANKPSR
jgi:predicted ABC-type ATPase